MIAPVSETSWYRLFWSKWLLLFAVLDVLKVVALYLIWKARG